MKTWVFLEGGYFNGTLYGVIDEENLPNEILLHHYENPQAIVQGVTILGITKKAEGDVTVVEKYVKPLRDYHPEPGKRTMNYEYVGMIDPSKVVKRNITKPTHDDPYGEYVLEEIDEAQD